MEHRIDNGDWTPMRHVETVDPSYYVQYLRWDLTNTLMPGRRPSQAVNGTHLWQGSISTELPVGVHNIYIRATDMFGRVFHSERSIRVEDPSPFPPIK